MTVSQEKEQDHSKRSCGVPQDEFQDSSSDDSMNSLEDLDETYIPPRGILLEQEEQRNITLRPRRDKNLEVNFTEFEIPNTYEEAMNSQNSHLWKKAIVEELQSHEENQTWILTDRTKKKNLFHVNGCSQE